jgi:hypothetical protein
MMFVVPVGRKQESITVQLNLEGTTHQTLEVTVSSSLRYRTWKRIVFNQPGEWFIAILHKTGDGVELLREVPVTVVQRPKQ